MAKKNGGGWDDGYSEEAVFRRLSPFHSELAEIAHVAFKRWLTIVPGFVTPYIRTRRSAMYDLMAQEARARFTEREGVLLRERHERVLLHFQSVDGVGPILVRFKHLDEAFRTRNYPTPAAVDFDEQRRLPSVPPGLRLTVGYQLDAAELALASLLVVNATGSDVHWTYELTRPGSGRVAELPPQRTFAEEAARRAAKRVTAKKKPGVVRKKDEEKK